MSYEEYETKPFEDIRRADKILNSDDSASPHGVALAQALLSLAQAKITGSLRR